MIGKLAAFATRVERKLKRMERLSLGEEFPPFDERYRHKALKLYKTATGTYCLPADATNDGVVGEMILGRVFEPEIVGVARTCIKPGTAVLDVGANFGQMSVQFADLVGPEGEVWSFEADDFVFHLMQKNAELNGKGNIRPVFGAVWDTGKNSVLYPVQDFKRWGSYGSYGIDPNAVDGRSVPTLTIDSLDIQKPISFMKVDIQGSDLFAMRGARRTIERHQMPIIFEFEDQFQEKFCTSFDDYIDFIRSISYRVKQVVQTLGGLNFLIVPVSQIIGDKE